MLPLQRVLVILAVTWSALACQQAPSVRAPLQGAWKAVHMSFESPDTAATVTDPQPSLYLFTARHYSIMYVPGSEPRALFPDDSPPTDAERLAAYTSFIANSGTYTVSDSTIETRVIVAKLPNYMGQSQTYVYRVQGDSLWLTFSPVPAPDLQVRVTLGRM